LTLQNRILGRQVYEDDGYVYPLSNDYKSDNTDDNQIDSPDQGGMDMENDNPNDRIVFNDSPVQEHKLKDAILDPIIWATDQIISLSGYGQSRSPNNLRNSAVIDHSAISRQRFSFNLQPRRKDTRTNDAPSPPLEKIIHSAPIRR
jgi:hypothetical protein